MKKLFLILGIIFSAPTCFAGDVDVTFAGGELDGMTVPGDVDASGADKTLFRSTNPADADAYFVLADQVDFSFSGQVPARIKEATTGKIQEVIFFAKYSDQGERFVAAWLQNGRLLIWQKPKQ